MLVAIDVLYLLGGALIAPVLAYERLVRGKRRTGWRQRFGHIERRRRQGRPCLWVHAVSVGEVNATRQLVECLRSEHPDIEVVVSVTTDTGLARASQVYPELLVFRYPLDLSWIVRRVLDRIRPDCIVLVELEVWPNLVAEARRRGIPVAVVNGRVTEERSMRRFRLPIVRHVACATFARLSWVGAQDEVYADRFRQLGVPGGRLEVTGSMKWDTAAVADHIEGDEQLATAMGIDRSRQLWVCGSTAPGEEEIILAAYSSLREQCPTVQLAIVPRKPERFNEVARLIQAHGYECIRRSRCLDGPRPSGADLHKPSAVCDGGDRAAKPRLFLGDTIGELRKFYVLADVIFIGRSLVPMGGSDLIEAAALGKPIVVGPHMGNFADAVAQLRRANAVVSVHDAETLAQATTQLIHDPKAARRTGAAARDVVLSNQGVTQRTVARLVELLPPRGGAGIRVRDAG